ncbi:Zn-dependent protease with chaperone function [Andreprevotia lacus DSM 23236]|uniref:Zn-dependent protease with chaperone function n=2 Tax=Andreprevotia TaxID=397275 RepID=A0A1W1XNK7_9NEIS|nr:Zn-dependent protease with chaperone function [Andreprevotia lacus DSM 23236]
MFDTDYEDLVHRLESDARRNPGSFKLKVLLVSMSAYLLLGLSLLLIVAIGWFAVWMIENQHMIIRMVELLLLLVAASIPVLFITVRMALIRLDAPKGIEITRKEAPRLFKLLDKLRSKLKAPHIHRVVIDNSMSATVFQLPRLGLFGGHSNHLVLGLPLLLACTPKEMLALIAHEYGLLAGKHGSADAWVYRQRLMFNALQERVDGNREDNFINGLMANWLNRIAPYFNAHTFVLARQNEYEADAAAAHLIGAQHLANGLTRAALMSPWLEDTFWPKLYAQADDRATPAFMPHAAMKKAFTMSREQWALQARLDELLLQNSDLHDTHPCLRDRLRALGQPARLPEAAPRTAAEDLLGELCTRLINKYDLKWWEDERANWQKHHHTRRTGKTRLAELTQQPLDNLDVMALHELAQLEAEHGHSSRAKAVLAHLQQCAGGPFGKASLLHGRILLAEKNGNGLDKLQEAAYLMPELSEQCAQLGFDYLARTEGDLAAESWLKRVFPRMALARQ